MNTRDGVIYNMRFPRSDVTTVTRKRSTLHRVHIAVDYMLEIPGNESICFNTPGKERSPC